MKHTIQAAAAAIVLLALTACAALNVYVPETFEERVVAGYGTVAGAAEVTGVLLDAGKIDAKDARNAHTQLTTFKEGIDVAVAIKAGGDFGNAEARLDATIAALNILREYLNKRGKGEAP